MNQVKISCRYCKVEAVAAGHYTLRQWGWFKNQGYKWVCQLCQSEEDSKYLW